MKLPFRREHTGTRQGDAMQRSAQQAARQVSDYADVPFLQKPHKLIRVTLTAFVSKTVRHNLGVPAAFFIVRPSTGSEIVYENAYAQGVDEANEISLGSGASGTWDLWFYPRAEDPETA
jgi:hypothetical protein